MRLDRRGCGDNGGMRLRFTKMQGAGNDFVMLDGIGQRLELTSGRVRALADRHFGIGADQVLLVERATEPGADFRFRIFNADGAEVEHCGNGARCFLMYVRQAGLTDRSSIRVQTASGLIEPRLLDDGTVSVDMGVPDMNPAASGFSTHGLAERAEGEAALWPLPVDGRQVWISVVSMGNPHAVQIVDDVEAFPVLVDGPVIELHPRFVQRVNAGFMQIVARNEIKLRVYERGAGETLACGTGACAAVATGIRRGLLDSPVKVHTHGGALTISWNGEHENAPLLMAGPAATVFEGEIELAD
jgi:diaminopimelate epimerase